MRANAPGDRSSRTIPARFTGAVWARPIDAVSAAKATAAAAAARTPGVRGLMPF